MVEIMGPHLLENPIFSSCLEHKNQICELIITATLKPVLDNTYLSRKNRFIKEEMCNPEQTTLEKNIKVINCSNLPCVMIPCFFCNSNLLDFASPECIQNKFESWIFYSTTF
jgi:hypothetical protein